jgi:hypothetical protein
VSGEKHASVLISMPKRAYELLGHRSENPDIEFYLLLRDMSSPLELTLFSLLKIRHKPNTSPSHITLSTVIWISEISAVQPTSTGCQYP